MSHDMTFIESQDAIPQPNPCWTELTHENKPEWDEDNDDEGRTFNNEGWPASDNTGGHPSDVPMETPTWDNDLMDPEPSGDEPRQSDSINAVPRWSQ